MIRVRTTHLDVPNEVYDWLDCYAIGEEWTSWAANVNGREGRNFYFHDPKIALLFKLTWGGK
jgi:hypothetical protein